MEEDYYSDKDEDIKVDNKIKIYYANKINNILKNAKIEIKGNLQFIVYLTQKQLNELYKGEPITLNLKTKLNTPKPNIFEFLTKDRSNLPSIIYLSIDQMMHISRYRNSTKKFKITLSKEQLSATLKEIKKVNKQIDSFFNDLKDKNKNYNILVNEEYNIFISNLMRYSCKTSILESRKQKITKVIKTLLEKTQRVGKYHQALVNISIIQIHNFIKKCIQGNTEGDFTLDLFHYHKEIKNISICSFSNKKKITIKITLKKYTSFKNNYEQQSIS